MDRGTAVALAALTLAGSLSGCLSTAPADGRPSGPNVAVQPGVEDPVEVGVRVEAWGLPTGRTGGLPVVFFTTRPPDGSGGLPRRGFGEPWQLDGCGSGETVESWGPFEVLARTRTDHEGVAYGYVAPSEASGVPEGAPVHVVVGGLGGYHQAIAAGPGPVDWSCGVQVVHRLEANTSLLLRLLPERRTFGYEGTLGRAVAADRGPSGSPVWRPAELGNLEGLGFLDRFGSRLERIDATLRWTNGPSSWSDLYLALGRSVEEGPRVEGTDRRQLPISGQSKERINVSVDGLARNRMIGPATDEGVFAVDRLPYTVQGRVAVEGPDLDLVLEG